MGRVFRATDTKLNRQVAIKVLPEEFSNDPDRLARFRRESELLASLNHPNVLTIHEAGIHDGTPFLVSELLEGETLRETLKRKGSGRGLAVEVSIRYGVQIAQGLAAAHARGVVHRDLKPENLYVTPDGRVKILDFGLAKPLHSLASEAVEIPSDCSELEASTLLATDPVNTEEGRVLGTPAYMSPEQIRGESVDRRTDFFP